MNNENLNLTLGVRCGNGSDATLFLNNDLAAAAIVYAWEAIESCKDNSNLKEISLYSVKINHI